MSENKKTGQVVLVVDDSTDTRNMMKQFLELEGYRVTEAVGGKEAVKVAISERPSLILLDLSMPYADGLIIARGLREEPELSETPIVIISSLEVSEVQEVTGQGYGYIPKPIDFAHLKALINVTFKGRL